jgi:hypothetical protein
MKEFKEVHIRELVRFIKPFYDCVESNYTWKKNSLPSPDGLDLSPFKTNFEQNLAIRAFVNGQIKNGTEKKVFRWIIHDWGGIRSFNDFDYIPVFLQELKSDYLSWKSSERISSLSKIAAFYAPQQYAIYDARVSLALNWTLYLETSYQGPFFKDLSSKSRNSTLIPDLKWNRTHTQSGSSIAYLPNPTFYFSYNRLLKQIATSIDPGNSNALQRMEMTFFSLPLQGDFYDKVITAKNINPVEKKVSS